VANYIPEMDKKAYAVWANDQIVTSRDPFSSELMGDELVKKLNK
jgi:putative intracellular protease/amidase